MYQTERYVFLQFQMNHRVCNEVMISKMVCISVGFPLTMAIQPSYALKLVDWGHWIQRLCVSLELSS